MLIHSYQHEQSGTVVQTDNSVKLIAALSAGDGVIPNPLQTIPVHCDPPPAMHLHYAVHPDHRNGWPTKSQWIIPVDREFAVFCMGADTCGGYMQDAVFGLEVTAAGWQYLGDAPTGEKTRVAKFTRDQAEWHGYPYLHTEPKAKIPRNVLETWHGMGVIRTSQYNRLLKKQPC